jgi:hypothetical protein
MFRYSMRSSSGSTLFISLSMLLILITIKIFKKYYQSIMVMCQHTVPKTDQADMYTTALRKPLRRKRNVISVRSRSAKSSKEVRLICAYHKAVHIITPAVEYVLCIVLRRSRRIHG